ncbi:MAG: hypothetical protein D3914_14055, partial [Candidatus Electrothrix sp. LOE2]|nr:hypothetical protein [Candidatus Electrothrix sp. LOE2]
MRTKKYLTERCNFCKAHIFVQFVFNFVSNKTFLSRVLRSGYMISIDITVLIHIINMIALMFILNKILYKPIIEIMEKRQDTLDALSNDVEKYERNAKDRQAEVEKKMREASVKAKETLDAARNQAAKAGAEKRLLFAGKPRATRKNSLPKSMPSLRKPAKNYWATWKTLPERWPQKYWEGVWKHESSKYEKDCSDTARGRPVRRNVRRNVRCILCRVPEQRMQRTPHPNT